MELYQVPNDEEVRLAYQQGEEAMVGLFHQLTNNCKLLAARMQALEDHARNSSNSGKPPSSDGLTNRPPRVFVNAMAGKAEGSRVMQGIHSKLLST